METLSNRTQVQRINLVAGQLHPPGSTANRLNYVVTGLFMLAAVFNLIDYFVEGTDLGRHLLISATYFLAAMLTFLKNRVELSSTSKYSPHLMVYEEGLKIKTSVLSKSQFFNWNDILQIELSNDKIGVKMNETKGLIYYPYPTQKANSIEKMKSTIEAVAAPKGIDLKKIS